MLSVFKIEGEYSDRVVEILRDEGFQAESVEGPAEVEEGDIFIFSGNGQDSRGGILRTAAHDLDGRPSEATPFLARLNPRAVRGCDPGALREAVLKFASGYARLSSQDLEMKGPVVPPWDPHQEEYLSYLKPSSKEELTQKWLPRARRAFRGEGISEVLQKHCTFQGRRSISWDVSHLAAVFCPVPRPGNGVRTGKVEKVISFFEEVGEASEKEVEVLVYLPSKEMADSGEMVRLLNPSWWGAGFLQERRKWLRDGEVFLRENVLQPVSGNTGVEINIRLLHTFKFYHNLILEESFEEIRNRSGLRRRFIDDLLEEGDDFKGFDDRELDEYALHSLSLYIAMFRALPDKTVLLGVEAGKLGWSSLWEDVIRPEMEESGKNFEVAWLPKTARQPFCK